MLVAYGCPHCKGINNIVLTETTSITSSGHFEMLEDGSHAWKEDDSLAEVNWDDTKFVSYHCKDCKKEFLLPIKVQMTLENTSG
jgi:hypothetical protein